MCFFWTSQSLHPGVSNFGRLHPGKKRTHPMRLEVFWAVFPIRKNLQQLFLRFSVTITRGMATSSVFLCFTGVDFREKISQLPKGMTLKKKHQFSACEIRKRFDKNMQTSRWTIHPLKRGQFGMLQNTG